MGENDRVLDLIEREARACLGRSRPGGWYSQDGDCLFFYNEDVPHQAVRLAGLVTVFEAIDDGRPVGIQIKGVRSLVERCKQLQVLIRKRESLDLIYLLNFAITFSAELPEASDLLARTFASSAKWSLPARDLQAVAAPEPEAPDS